MLTSVSEEESIQELADLVRHGSWSEREESRAKRFLVGSGLVVLGLLFLVYMIQ
jgi:hypothetical protein